MPERARSYRLWCVLLLLLSVVTRLALGLLTPNGMNLVDLHVYVDGSAALLSGELYDFTYSRDTPDFPLPFTYPPFAALVFLPLHYLPFGVLGILWLLLTIAALFWVIRIALDLLVGPVARGSRWTSVALVWTAIAVWIEPVRTTLDYGQINVFLVLAVMLAVRSNRWWLSGGLVGIVAGIKLTPAITGVYFLASDAGGRRSSPPSCSVPPSRSAACCSGSRRVPTSPRCSATPIGSAGGIGLEPVTAGCAQSASRP